MTRSFSTAAHLACRLGLLLLAFSAVPAGADPILSIDRDQVNIRADATVRARRVTVLYRGDQVEEIRRHNEWVQVRMTDGRRGWVHGSLVRERLVVEGQGVRVRSGASSQSSSVTMLYRGQEVEGLGRRGSWLEVRLRDGRVGWVHGQYVRSKTRADLSALTPQSPSLPKAETAPVQAVPMPAAPEATPDTRDAVAETGPAATVGDDPSRHTVDPVAEASPAEDADGSGEDQEVRRNSYAEGLQYEASGEHSAALKSFERVLEGDPGNISALSHAAQAHRQLGQYEQALEKLYHALEQSGGRKDVYLTLGEVYRVSGEPDSAAKYNDLYWGRQVSPSEPETSVQHEEPERQLPVVRLALAGLLLVALIGLGTWWALRKGKGPSPPRSTGKPRSERKFERTLEREDAQVRGGRISSEEERELDGQIEEKWRALRESSHTFAGTSQPAQVEEGGVEDGQLNRILDHVEALRQALDLQDDRAQIYADVVRLQNMKIEAMEEQLRLLRGRS